MASDDHEPERDTGRVGMRLGDPDGNVVAACDQEVDRDRARHDVLRRLHPRWRAIFRLAQRLALFARVTSGGTDAGLDEPP